MRKTVRSPIAGALVAASLLALSACVSITAATGPTPVAAGGYSVVLDQTWSDVTSLYGVQTPKTRVLTLDGVLLDRLYLIGGIAPGAPIVKSFSKEKPTPLLRADMSPTELVEFTTDSIAALGYKRVESTGLRPQSFAGSDGLRIDYLAQTDDGLEISGAALVAVTNGKLNAIVFLAPKEYYFQQNIDKVEAIFRSATFKK
jgi:hypothetical protein